MESRDTTRREEHFPMQIVCIYAMREEPFYHELQTHLSLWQREGYIQWLETQAGRNMEQTMHAHLRQADLILLLISPSFFAHDLCYTAMKAALQEYTRRMVPVVPVLARASDWKESACGGLHALPDNEQPLAEWSHPEQAYENIRAGLARFIPGLSVQGDRASPEAIYRKLVVKAYQWLNFSGFDRSDLSLSEVPLEKIFVRLSLTVEKVVREPVPEDRASGTMWGGSHQRERVTTVQEPIELGKTLGNHLLIVGEPGAGKSTLLRWLAVTFAEYRQQETDRVGPSADSDRLPILVELGRLPDRYLKPEGAETPNWLQFLPQYLASQMAFTGTPSQLLTRALEEGRCLLLFDGLDEVANREARFRLARSLAEMARLLPGNRVIIGSRPAGVSESEGTLHPLFQRCQIQRFTPEDVQRFFRFWYALDRSLTPKQQLEDADALYARVRATPATLQLASTPLLSTILVLIWLNKGNLPKRRVELYEYCCRVLIERWEAHHRVVYQHHEIYQGVLAGKDWKDHLFLLTPLAYFIHSQEQRTSATREEIIPLFARALQTARYVKDQATAEWEAKDFLDTLSLRSGLLQYIGKDEKDHDLYSFPHLTFQEYLAARYIAAQPEYTDLVMTHLHEAWWQQVHLLTIAHLGSSPVEAEKASSLILTILHVYPPPTWILRSSGNFWLDWIGPARYLPWVQLGRRIAWVLAREFELAVRGYAECIPNEAMAIVGKILSVQAVSLIRHIHADPARLEAQKDLLAILYEWAQDKEDVNKAALSTLQQTLHRKRLLYTVAESLGLMAEKNESVARVLGQILLHAENDVQEAFAIGSLKPLSKANEAIVSVLLEALEQGNSMVQVAAAESLGRLGGDNKAIVAVLLHALRGKDRGVQVAAAKSLGEVGGDNEAVVSALLQALKGGDRDVRQVVEWSLKELKKGNEAVVNVLLHALHDEDSMVRLEAAGRLGEVGEGNEVVVAALLDALHRERGPVRSVIAGSLGQLGKGNEAVVAALLNMLHNEDEWERLQAAYSLEQLGEGNEVMVNVLLSVLEKGVRMRKVVEGLGQAGEDNKEMVNILRQALHDGVLERRVAARSLGRLGEGNEAVIAALLDTLHNDNVLVQVEAAGSLGQLGKGNEVVVAALLDALYGHTWVRQKAAESLGRLGKANEVVATLQDMLHNENEWERQDAVQSLGYVGESSETVMAALQDALHDEDWGVLAAAARSLGQLGKSNEVVAALLNALHHEDQYVRQKAAESLGRLGEGNEAVMAALLHILRDAPDTDQVLKAAAESLGQLGKSSETVVTTLLGTLQGKDWRLRRAAARSLGQVGEGNEVVVATLQDALYDKSSQVRAAAVESLRQLGMSSKAMVTTLLGIIQDNEASPVVQLTDSLFSSRSVPVQSLGQIEVNEITLLRRVLVVLNRQLHGIHDVDVRSAALVSIRQLLDGRPIPGYRWVPLGKRQAKKQQLKRIAFWLGTAAFMVLIGLAATWLLGVLDPNSFLVRFMAVLAGIIASAAAFAQILGRVWRNPWERS